MKNQLISILTIISLLSCSTNESKSSIKNKNESKSVEQALIDTVSTHCEKCSIEELKKAQIMPFDEDKVKIILCLIDKRCNNNVEFSEMYDETIYSLLLKNPELFLKEIESKSHSSQELIFKKISSPLLDYDYDKIINTVKSLNTSKQFSKELIEALEKAKKGDL